MNPADLEQARALFALALEQTAAERPAFLDETCKDEPKLRANVESLLSAADQSAGAPASPTVPHPADQTASETNDAAGSTIGPYKLLQLIGEGGFGSVFMAEQQHPVRRRVALKIIKLGMDTRAVIARFDAERQALAMMDHPNIAKILDAGETAAGRPYFVMELVKGIPITQYCDMNKLPTSARLDLFVAVCNALQHAHQKGIIHRDIKPSNILVTLHDGKPVPKLIDFGIAKATQARLTEMTLFTEFRQFIGTPAYMSPEQAEMSGLDVDTRSDIYSLGVLLYELLTGTTPFDPKELRAAGYAEIQRIIREVDPPRPSTRLSTLGVPLATIAANRDVEPRKLNQIVRGELDWIVMKALEKDRTRRYESAGELARDIGRHLEDQPVEACPPSRGYRLKKFIQRNRAVVSTSGLIIIVAVGATGLYVHAIRAEQHKTESALANTRVQRAETEKQKRAADQQRDEARKQERIATSISAFLSNMLSSADPEKLMGDRVTVVQAIEAAVQQLDAGGGTIDPLTEASLRDTVGKTLMELGRYDDAEPQLRKAMEICLRHLPAGHQDTERCVTDLATLLSNQNRREEAEKLFRQSLAMCRAALPAGDPEIAARLNNLAIELDRENKPQEAEKLFREALAIRRKALPMGDPYTASSLSNLAGLLAEQHRDGEALELFGEALRIDRAAHPGGHPDIAKDLSNLTRLLPPAEAEKAHREALEIDRRFLPASHPDIARLLYNYASFLTSQDRAKEAEPAFREALAIYRKTLPPGHPDIARNLTNLAILLESMNRPAEAEPMYREALKIFRHSLPADDPEVTQALEGLGVLLLRQKRWDEAEKLLRETLSIRRAAFPAGHPDIARVLYNLAIVAAGRGKPDESEKLYSEALQIYRTGMPAMTTETVSCLNGLAIVLAGGGRNDEAEKLIREALGIDRRLLPAGDPALGRDLNNLGLVVARSRPAEAEKLYRQALDIRRAALPATDPDISLTLDNLANLLDGTGRSDEAKALRASATVSVPETPPGDLQPTNRSTTSRP